MINHNIESMDLSQNDEGEIYLPSESKPVTFESDLRQFIILTRRAYNESALLDMEQSEGLKVAQHTPHDDATPYFGVTLGITPKYGKTLEDFIDEHGDSFFSSLLQITSVNTQRGVSGKRAVFVREFRKDDPFASDTLYTRIVISTSVFYNDYRVTTGFPSNQQELISTVQSIRQRLYDQWGHELDFQIDAVENPYEETVEDCCSTNRTLINPASAWPFPT